MVSTDAGAKPDTSNGVAYVKAHRPRIMDIVGRLRQYGQEKREALQPRNASKQTGDDMRSFFDANHIASSISINEETDRQESSVVVFNNAQYGQVRMVLREGEPWFIAKDVCACLGLDMTHGVRGLEDEEKDLHTVETLGGPQQMAIVSEPGLYDLVGRSRKPEAKAFWHWVRHEVLVSIRKTGFYSKTPIPTVTELVANPDLVIALATQVKELQAAKDFEAARADLAIATKGRIVAGRDSRLMQQRHDDLRTIRRKDDRNGKLEAMYAERGIELGAERVRADKAENALGIGKTYRCVTNIPWFREVFDLKNCRANVVYQQAGKRLKKLSDELGYGYQTVPGHRFDSKAYHIDVIGEFYDRLVNNPDLMGPYRKR